jgi:glutamate-1-semialdehyde 2,1-aminomutase
MGRHVTAEPATATQAELASRLAAVDIAFAERASAPESDRTIEGAYPTIGARAQGAFVWDADGRRYIDLHLGYGPVILGHADPTVTEAVHAEIRSGLALSLPSTTQVVLAELICSVVPYAERVLLLKTGSDATSAAVRLARAFTGRDKVVRWGYNGWHDWCCPRRAGIPESVDAETLGFTYNDAASLERTLAAHRGQVACVILMPYELDPPMDGFLNKVAELAHAHGALFILDEVRSGFRLARGGAQEYFGVRADLATFSKAIANGYPLSAVTGRADVLVHIRETHISSTFFADPISMAAAVATIGRLTPERIAHIWDVGSALQDGLARLGERHGVPIRVRGLPPTPFVTFAHENVGLRERQKQAFFATLAIGGVLAYPSHHWFVCAAMTQAEVDATLQACDAALQAARAVADSG